MPGQLSPYFSCSAALHAETSLFSAFSMRNGCCVFLGILTSEIISVIALGLSSTISCAVSCPRKRYSSSISSVVRNQQTSAFVRDHPSRRISKQSTSSFVIQLDPFAATAFLCAAFKHPTILCSRSAIWPCSRGAVSAASQIFEV